MRSPSEKTMRAIGSAYGIGALAMALGPSFGGALTQLIDWRAALLAFVPIAGACFAVATVVGAIGAFVISRESNLGFIVAALAVIGIGYGLGWSMASVGTQTVVPPEQAGEASGLTLALVIGVAGLAVAVVGMLLEAGGGSATSLGALIQNVLLWIALGTAVGAAGLGLLAAAIARGLYVASQVIPGRSKAIASSARTSSRSK